MTPHQILIVGIRLLALLWLIHVISNMYGLFAYLDEGAAVPLSRQVVWFFASLQVATAAMLWFFPATIAAKLLRSPRIAPEEPAPRLIEWQTLGVISIGLWTLTRAIPDAVYWATFVNMASSVDPALRLEPDQKAGIIATAVELAIGCGLLLGAKGITALLFKLRTAGVEK